MKNIYFLLILSVLLSMCISKDGAGEDFPEEEGESFSFDELASGWTEISDFPGEAREGSAILEIENNIILAGGRSNDLETLNKVWLYNIKSNQWSEVNSMPYRKSATSHFSINNIGYILGGFNIEKGLSASNDFLSYSGEQKIWEENGNFPGDPIQLAGSFTIGTKAYIIGGITTPGSFGELTKDVWMYDQITNSWTKMKDFPGDARLSAVAFSSDSHGYFGMGTLKAAFSEREPVNDMWKYDPKEDEWSQITDFPGEARTDPTHFTFNNSAYIGTGLTRSNGYINDFYKISFTTNSWEQIEDFPGEERLDAIGFSLDKIGFVGLGRRISEQVAFTDVWVYKD